MGSEAARSSPGFRETFLLERHSGGEMLTVMTQDERSLKLVERATRGERDAFEELVADVGDRLLSTIRRRVGKKLGGKLEPEDVLQETLVRAFRSIERFRWQGEGSFRRWLEGIASHVILHTGRTHARKREIRIERDPQAEDLSPSRNERRHERFDRLKKSLDELAPDYRTVIRLSRIEGLKISEIAEHMGRSPSAIKNLLLRALKQLRESFGETESLGLPDRHLGEDSAHGE